VRGSTTGHRLATYHGHTDAVFAVAWSPDGKRIASGSKDGTIQVWNATTGQHLMTYANSGSMGSTDFTKAGPSPWNAVTWSPDGKRIASGTNGDLVVLDAATGKHLASYGYHEGVGHAVAWSPDGRYLAMG
jgi:WD40 repeat protein